MSQILVPVSDVNSNWSCSSGTTRYSLIDEISYNDADYITTNLVTMYEAKLLSGIVPINRANHQIMIRAKAAITGKKVGVYLYQGSTAIASPLFTLTTSFSTQTYTLTEAEALLITNYADLRFRIDSSVANTKYVSQAILIIPDGLSVGLEMGCNF